MKNDIKVIAGTVVAIVLVLIVLAVGLFTKNDSGQKTPAPESNSSQEQTNSGALSEEAIIRNQEIMAEIVERDEKWQERIVTINLGQEDETGEGTSTAATIKALGMVPGVSLVNIDNGQVIHDDGTAVNNSALSSSPEAPRQSVPLAPEAAVPPSAVKLTATMDSFSPNFFTVKAGQLVTLVITNANETTFSETFRFDDPILAGVVIAVMKGETKMMNFNAPNQPGEYTFYSSILNHRDLGAEGKMIVE